MIQKIKMLFQRTAPCKLSENDKEAIKNADWDTLCSWYFKLNSYKWVDALPPEEPPVHIKDDRRGYIMDAIKTKVGTKYLLRYHNVTKGHSGRRMTESEFEDFWNGSFCGDIEAAERDYKRLYEWHILNPKPFVVEDNL